MHAWVWAFVVSAVALAGACSSDPPDPGPPAGAASGASSAFAQATAETVRGPLKAPERSGGALMRSADGARLYLADEDHKVVRTLPLPYTVESVAAASASAAPSSSQSAKPKKPFDPMAPPPPRVAAPPPPDARQHELVLPGAPAAVLPLDGRVLVTVRDPGMLMVLSEEPGDQLSEQGRVPLAADAWGVAITPDEKVAVVTSAWTHRVSGIDLTTKTVLWSLDVAREPRGVVIHPNGKTAYVSHLTSGDLTRIDDIALASAKASSVAFPAAPSRAPQGVKVGGSLGYALVIDDAGNRLLAARHALGALGENAWFGIPTIDVLQLANDKPLLAPRIPEKRIGATPAFIETKQWNTEHIKEAADYRHRQFSSPALTIPDFAQPRAMVIAHSSQTVWLASEGFDAVGEFPLYAGAPIERSVRSVSVGDKYEDPKIIGTYGGASIAAHCGAPTGLALSADETLLYVFCRSTYDVATVRIAGTEITRIALARVASEPVDESTSRGRRLFYSALDSYSSGGLGCAGCHPDGRDDGHVWHEVITDPKKNQGIFLASKNLAFKTNDGKLGYPRQTPMLAGRVNASGPFGWHAQNDNLAKRLAEGFDRHRWWPGMGTDPNHWMTNERANALASFLRKGLATPPKIARQLDETEEKGRTIFESEKAKCSTCHASSSEFTNRTAYPLKSPQTPPGFEDEEDDKFKTPSLLFVGGTAPYFHDGRAATLEALIDQNGDRMGETSHLSAAEKAALVAYLRTL